MRRKISLVGVLLGVFAVGYLAATWLYAISLACYGLILPGWTDSAWRFSTRAYYLYFFLLAMFAMVFAIPLWLSRSKRNLLWTAVFVSPLVVMSLARMYYWEQYPPWDRDLRAEWQETRELPDYMFMSDEEYWEQQRQDE